VPKAVYRSGFYDKHATAHGGILSHRNEKQNFCESVDIMDVF